MPSKKLGVGFIGSGFVTRFHIQSWAGVRDADVLGVYSLRLVSDGSGGCRHRVERCTASAWRR